MSYAHVENENARNYLNNEVWDSDVFELVALFEHTGNSVASDMENTELHPDVVDARMDKYHEALCAIEDGRYEHCFEALREYWLI